jgi:hypothetical protein
MSTTKVQHNEDKLGLAQPQVPSSSAVLRADKDVLLPDIPSRTIHFLCTLEEQQQQQGGTSKTTCCHGRHQQQEHRPSLSDFIISPSFWQMEEDSFHTRDLSDFSDMVSHVVAELEQADDDPALGGFNEEDAWSTVFDDCHFFPTTNC